tara:strand:- start:111 stop:758 length:648 start_codon:yes stop_codon:yes gene_type:complete
MKIFVFDTETTGLPTERNASLLASHKWPYIVQLSYLLYDTEEKMVLDYVDNIIKLPSTIVIEKAAENVHKITTEISQTKGVDIKKELIAFNNALSDADLIVGHNISFDKNMIIVECYRHKILNKFTLPGKRPNEFCTMKNSINLCKLERSNSRGEPYYKYPKLMELYKHLFGDIPVGLHNSMVDVLACLRCYGKMKLDVDLLEQSSSLKMLNNMY